MLESYFEYIKPEYYFEPYGIHGVGHIRRVLFLASKISEHLNLSEDEERIVALSCVYHDIGRVHDNEDNAHGAMSVKKLRDLKLLDSHGCSDEEKDLIERLITAHCIDDSFFVGTKKERVLYNVLKDADGLDRVRCGDLDLSYLRFEESKDLASLAWALLLGLETI